MCDRDATECARCWLTIPGRASTKRFLFLMMPTRRRCAKSASESNNDFNMVKLWILALWSVAGSAMPLFDLASPREGGQ